MTFRCVPFPHSHLFCGQYIDRSTMVYVDANVYMFNYTEANNRIIELDSGIAFGSGKGNSCRWIVMYMICLSIYPHCNITTQALVPPCMNDCLKYTEDICRGNILSFTFIANLNNNPVDEKLVLNCSTPFRAFNSVSVDTENCYNFSCKLIAITRLIKN